MVKDVHGIAPSPGDITLPPAPAAPSRTNVELRKMVEDLTAEVGRVKERHIRLYAVWGPFSVGLALFAGILAAVGGVGAIATNDVWAGYISVAAAIIATIIAVMKPGEVAASHHQTALRYGAIERELREVLWQIPAQDGAATDQLAQWVPARLAAIQDVAQEVENTGPALGFDLFGRLGLDKPRQG